MDETSAFAGYNPTASCSTNLEAAGQGVGVAVADLNGNGTPDLIVMMVDNPPAQNRRVYRVGHDLDANGNVTGCWTPSLRAHSPGTHTYPR